MSATPGCAWRRRAISSVTLWLGSWPPSPGFDPCAILISISSAWAKYSVVTPKRADATCFTLLLRIAGDPGKAGWWVGSSPRSPVVGRVFSSFASIGASAELVHGLGDGLVRLGAQRAQRHR